MARINPIIAGFLDLFITQYGVRCAGCEYLFRKGFCQVASPEITDEESCKKAGGHGWE